MALEVVNMLEAMTRSWGALAFCGAVAILFGIVAFVWPGVTIGVLVLLLAAFAFLIVLALQLRRLSHGLSHAGIA